MYYLTVNNDPTELTMLWDQEPIYFEKEGVWAQARYPLVSSSSFNWPGLQQFARGLGLKPGAKGIMEVTVEIKAAGSGQGVE